MPQQPKYKLSVGSADQYENMIAEIDFYGKAGIILSMEEGDRDYQISLHSFSATSRDDYSYCRNVNEVKIPLNELQEAITAAVKELNRLNYGELR